MKVSTSEVIQLTGSKDRMQTEIEGFRDCVCKERLGYVSWSIYWVLVMGSYCFKNHFIWFRLSCTVF